MPVYSIYKEDDNWMQKCIGGGTGESGGARPPNFQLTGALLRGLAP